MVRLLTLCAILFIWAGDGHANEVDEYTKCNTFVGGYTEFHHLVQIHDNGQTFLPPDAAQRNHVQVTIERREENDLLGNCTKIGGVELFIGSRMLKGINYNPIGGRCNFQIGPENWGPLVTKEELDKFCSGYHSDNNRNIRVNIPFLLKMFPRNDPSHVLESCKDYAVIDINCAVCAPLTADNLEKSGIAVVGNEYMHTFDVKSSDSRVELMAMAPYSCLPEGLRVDFQNDRIAGIPRKPGIYDTSVLASDNCAFGRQHIKIPFQLTVNCAPLEISGELPQAYGGARYSFDLNSLKHNGQAPVGFKFVSGSLPEGLGFDESTGIIAGAPKHENTSPWKPSKKTYPLVVRLTDSCALGARSLDKSLTLVVTHAPLKPGPTPAGQVEKQRPPMAIPGTPPPVAPKRPPVLKDQSVAPQSPR